MAKHKSTCSLCHKQPVEPRDVSLGKCALLGSLNTNTNITVSVFPANGVFCGLCLDELTQAAVKGLEEYLEGK